MAAAPAACRCRRLNHDRWLSVLVSGSGHQRSPPAPAIRQVAEQLHCVHRGTTDLSESTRTCLIFETRREAVLGMGSR